METFEMSLENVSLPSGNNSTIYTRTEDGYAAFYIKSQFITGIILYPLFCIPGVIGNILTLIVLSHKTMQSSTNAFLSALAVSDMIKLLNDLLYFVVLLVRRSNETYGGTAFRYVYPYAHFIFNVAASVSSWLTVSVAAERYLLVCHATKAKTICTRCTAISVSAAIYVIMISLATPSAIRYKTVELLDSATNMTKLEIELTNLWRNEDFVTAYTWTENLLRSVIPLLILIILNTYIINALRKTRANRKFSSRNRITFMLIMVIVVFMICITPDAIMSTFFGYGYYEANFLAKGIREFTDTLLTLNAALNFVLYCLFNKIFREHFQQLFCRKSDQRRNAIEPDESQYRRLSEPKHAARRNKSITSPV